MIVVSEMGEQWSPITAPPRVAAMAIISISLPLISSEVRSAAGMPPENTGMTMGSRMVKVPQEVPVAKPRNAAIRNTTAGRKFFRPGPNLDTRSATNSGAEGLGHIADGPGQAQDQDGGHHLLEAVGQAVHQLSEAHGPAHHEEEHGKDQGNQGAERQGVKGGGIGEGGDEVGAAVLVAHIDHGAHAAPHQHKHRQYQINDLAIGIELHLFHTGKGAFGRGVEVALSGVVLMLAHGTVVDIQAGHHNDEHQGQNGVIVVGMAFRKIWKPTSSLPMIPVTAAAQEETGIIMHTGPRWRRTYRTAWRGRCGGRR